jgi:hypothetical protein
MIERPPAIAHVSGADARSDTEALQRTYRLAFTRRATSKEPVGHAGTSRRNGRTVRSSFVALCGAAIAWPGPGGTFDPTHPRACRRCAEELCVRE